MRNLLAATFTSLLSTIAWSMNYDFDKLRSQPQQQEFVFYFQNVAVRATNALSEFANTDSLRIDIRAHNQAISQAANSSNSTNGSNSSNSTATKAADTSSRQKSNTYVCTLYCNSSKGPKTSYQLTASSRSEAAKYANQNSDSICKNAGYSKSSDSPLDESQCSLR